MVSTLFLSFFERFWHHRKHRLFAGPAKTASDSKIEAENKVLLTFISGTSLVPHLAPALRKERRWIADS